MEGRREVSQWFPERDGEPVFYFICFRDLTDCRAQELSIFLVYNPQRWRKRKCKI